MTSGQAILLVDEAATVAFGRQLAKASGGKGVIFLYGDLGAGKTTLCRGVLQHLGHEGAVKSPTYTLVEPYKLESGQVVYHFDLYRLGDPEELEFLGGREYFNQSALCLVEWPERGAGFLPPADIKLTLQYQQGARTIEVLAFSQHGQDIAAKLAHDRNVNH
ncbi:tRNA (adenosine(37)-N6)-threonylcarbamoyltransferase complex ATPase subunit type 1 TsaE [Zooshikella marina]|uniref:tRNA (adenosine(37)-N6)-threonylcarbamoyltransferase complex ATPase subunit type 1 TsaE n=1 Tax=Zooshikella ganghwensis TaxID=202772 RepID=UPI001BAE5792|nr:tRNA (adenosine(37)-N6)-threonylcarbamoyltransferase complex ATPase subunit type 1 TsaE [Zooshikella ganghwensis]MBU2706203.1 tRNA (adenosine(37)-N6)-threonylcarbamoyltransferase complex ATPase subunit type 1 TsaE [Zooshikella ganghwensis]